MQFKLFKIIKMYVHCSQNVRGTSDRNFIFTHLQYIYVILLD